MGSHETVAENEQTTPKAIPPFTAATEAKRFSRAGAVLFRAARAGEVRLAVTFGGQGAEWLPELRQLYSAHLAVRTLVHACTERLRSAASHPDLGALALPVGSFDLTRWVEDANAAPQAAVLGSSLVSQPGNFIAQIAQLLAMSERGFDLEALASLATATAGHSHAATDPAGDGDRLQAVLRLRAREFREAAVVDGASDSAFSRVYLPMNWGVTTALAIITFIGVWNAFLWPFLAQTSDTMMTVTVGITQVQRPSACNTPATWRSR